MFAAELDDGEARSAAVALHRGLWLVTDDRPSLRVARTNVPAIPSLTTPEWMKQWAEGEPAESQAVRDAVHRIEMCARYRPRRLDPLHAWWTALQI
jgi:hypothetical protein